MIGSVGSHNRVLRALGRGGFASVFLAEDTRLHRPVALKFLERSPTGESEVWHVFQNEARAIAELNPDYS